MPRVLPVLLLLLLAGCTRGPVASGEPPLAGARMGGPFTLVGEDGKPVSDTDFAGQYRLMYFGYSYCPDICPVDLAKLMAGFRELERVRPELAGKIQPIFVTVDPERDTPAALAQYTDQFHPRLLGLTGSPDRIKSVSSAYGVGATREEAEGASEYLMAHSNLAVLYGPDGEPITTIEKAAETPPEAIADELARWVT